MSNTLIYSTNPRYFVTVILSTYNDDNLSDCLTSLSLQTFPFFKVILINDGGRDVAGLISKFPNLNIKYFNFSDNLGLPVRLNFAIKLVDTEFIARIDSDDYALPDRLQLQYEHIIKYKYDLIGCSVVSHYENGDYKIQHTLSDESVLIKQLKYFVPLAHPTFFGTTYMFKNLLYSPDLTYSQDYDFVARAVLSGYRIGNLSIPLLVYNVSRPNSIFKVFYQVKATISISSAYIDALRSGLPYSLKFNSMHTNTFDQMVAWLHIATLRTDHKPLRIVKLCLFCLVSIISPIYIKYNLLRLSSFFNR